MAFCAACALGIALFSNLARSRAQQPADGPRRFDPQVRRDFFAGMRGDKDSFARAMKTCEDALAKDPKNAEALVWHGAGLYFEAKGPFMKGDYQKGMGFQRRGIQEMNDALSMQPENVGVLIPRAAVFLAAAPHIPAPDAAKQDFQTATDDYEKVLKLQAAYFGMLPVHSRGELLGALAEGWWGLGNADTSKEYLTRMVKEVPGSVYAQRADALLTMPPKSGTLGTTCLGCHID